MSTSKIQCIVGNIEWFTRQMVARRQVKAAVSVLTMAMVLAYFDVFKRCMAPDTKVVKRRLLLCLCCFVLGAFFYFWNVLQFVISLPPSKRVTSERWIYKNPVSVFCILGAYALSFVLGVLALIPEYGVAVGLFISVLVAVVVNDMSQWLTF